MSRKTTATAPELFADPFQEHSSQGQCLRFQLLGAEFEFEGGDPQLRRIVARAYSNLPRHKLSAAPPRFRIKLMRAPRVRSHARGDAPRIEMLSGAGLLGAATSAADFVALSPAQRAGLVVVSQPMRRFPYHLRYELIEFAVFTLAARVQGLVPLHAACIGRHGRGLLLMGDSGAGKSTASLQWLAQGLEFVSEDSVFVAPRSMSATGVANFIHIRRDTLRFLSPAMVSLIQRSPVIRRRSGVEKLEIDLRRPQFRLAPRPLEIVGSVFMTRETAGGRPLLAPLRRTELAARWQATQPYAAAQVGWGLFKTRIANRPAFELRRGNHPNEVVEALQTVLARSTHA